MKNLCHFEMGGVWQMLTSSGGGGGRLMLTVADRGEGGNKICQNLADVICERSLTHRIAARTVSGRDHETMTHVPRDTHVTKQRMAMRSNFPWSDFKKLGTPELSSSSSTSTSLSPKNFE